MVNRGGGQVTWTYHEFDPSRGTATYSLLFTGEILQTVDFQHAGTPLSTDDAQNQKEAEKQPKTPLPPTTNKPNGTF